MKQCYTGFLVLALLLTLVAPVAADAAPPAPPQTDAYGKSLNEWQLLYLTWLLGGDPVDHLGHVRFLPLPQGEAQGENPVILVGQQAVTLDPGAAFVLPIFTWVGERYDNGSEDQPLPSTIFTNLTVQITLDGQPLIDSNTDTLDAYYFGPQTFAPPIPYAEPQPRDSDGDGAPDLFAVAMIWAQGVGFVYPPLSVGEHTVTLYAVSEDFGFGYDNTWTITVEPSIVETVYLSLRGSGKVGKVAYRNEDIVAYDPTTGTWSLYFDGSDVGLSSRNVDGFALTPDGRLLLSLDAPYKLPGLGAVDDSDIVKFIPTSLGEATAGRFVLYFDGSDVGLTSSSEDIDALAMTPDGKLIVSTSGSLTAPGVKGKDEDLFVFTATELGKQTRGSWQPYFDGSTIGLTAGSEDLDGVGWRPLADGATYVSTKGDYTVSSKDSLYGDADDIFAYQPNEPGAETPHYRFVRYFDGDQAGLDHARIDAFFIGAVPATVALPANIDRSESDLIVAAEAEEAAETVNAETTEIDEELDEYDLSIEEEADAQQIYLPIVVHP